MCHNPIPIVKTHLVVTNIYYHYNLIEDSETLLRVIIMKVLISNTSLIYYPISSDLIFRCSSLLAGKLIEALKLTLFVEMLRNTHLQGAFCIPLCTFFILFLACALSGPWQRLFKSSRQSDSDQPQPDPGNVWALYKHKRVNNVYIGFVMTESTWEIITFIEKM